MPGSRSLSIVPLAQAAGLARLETGSLELAHAGFVKCLYELNHDRLESVEAGAKLVLSKSGSSTVFKDSRAILFSDFKPNVREAMDLARRLDGEYEELGVIEIPVTKTTPALLTALVERITTTRKLVFGDKFKGTLLAHPEGRSVLIVAPRIEESVWRDLVERFDRAEPVSTRNYIPRRFGVRETSRLVEQVMPIEAGGSSWKMVVDDLTGTLGRERDAGAAQRDRGALDAP
jgi:hypothetical protein